MAGKLDQADIDNAIELYRSGLSVNQVAERVGVSPMTIYKYVRLAGIARGRVEGLGLRAKAARDAIRDDVVRRFKAGGSVKAIAEGLGLERSTVVLCLADAGLRPRSRRDAMLQRMGDLSAKERKALASAANKAARGRKRTIEEMEKSAEFKQRSQTKVGKGERELMKHLAALDPVPQFAFGPYNIDIMCWPIAVEVHVTSSNPLKISRCRERIKYLLDRSISVVYIWLQDADRLQARRVAKIISDAYFLQGDPTEPAQYQVVRGTGELVASGRSKLD